MDLDVHSGEDLYCGLGCDTIQYQASRLI